MITACTRSRAPIFPSTLPACVLMVETESEVRGESRCSSAGRYVEQDLVVAENRRYLGRCFANALTWVGAAGFEPAAPRLLGTHRLSETIRWPGHLFLLRSTQVGLDLSPGGGLRVEGSGGSLGCVLAGGVGLTSTHSAPAGWGGRHDCDIRGAGLLSQVIERGVAGSWAFASSPGAW
jgi:hypothetical protein